MTNKEFVNTLSKKVDIDSARCSQLVESLVGLFVDSLAEGQTLTVQGFGNFEHKHKVRRKIYHPTTKTYKVIPSKVVVNYKMSPVLKEKINS